MEFLQSTYFQIAAVVVAAVLLLLLILLIRKRHTTASTEVRSGFGGAQRMETAAPLVNAGTQGLSLTTPTPAAESPAPPAAPWQAQMPAPALTADALVATIASMIARPDPINESDFRRLAIYRPDRVMAAVSSLTSAVEPDRHAAVKLQKLAAIRSHLEAPPAGATAPEAPTSEPEAMAVETEPAATTPATEPLVTMAAGEPEAAREALQPETGAPLEVPPPADMDSAAELQAQVGLESRGAEPEGRESPPSVVEQQAELATGETRVDGEPEVPVESVTESSPPQTTLLADLLPDSSSRPEPDLTAEQFFQLSESERASGLHRLPATELGKALRSSREDGVKTQIIDRLAQLGTGEALLALDEFLGDADSSAAQLYALSAAERLLAGGREG